MIPKSDPLRLATGKQTTMELQMHVKNRDQVFLLVLPISRTRHDFQGTSQFVTLFPMHMLLVAEKVRVLTKGIDLHIHWLWAIPM